MRELIIGQVVFTLVFYAVFAWLSFDLTWIATMALADFKLEEAIFWRGFLLFLYICGSLWTAGTIAQISDSGK